MAIQDFRKGKKVVLTIELEDKGQDFTELDVLENGVLLGYSSMFMNGRLALVGIGTLNGTTYHTREEVLQLRESLLDLKGLSIYFRETTEKDPLPWEASTLKYKITGLLPVKDADRFLV